MSCINANSVSILLVRANVQRMPGWTDHVKGERDRSLFWQCIWLEAGKPFKGFMYEIIKRTRHSYHYAVRCCKRNVLQLKNKNKLTETVTNSSQFWSELKKINPSQRISTLKIDTDIGKVEIAELLAEKYKYLYNSVPTKASELYEKNSTIKNHNYNKCRCRYYATHY